MWKIWTCSFLLVLFLFFVSFKAYRNELNKRKEAEILIKQKEKNMVILREYAERKEANVSEILRIENEIRKAENEEELNKIAADIISRNNMRLQHNSRNK